jgi:predicted aspartyl protease
VYKTIAFISIMMLTTAAGAADFGTSIPLIEKGTETYYVSASVGSARFDLLVDTGAGFTALNRPLLERLKASGHARRVGAVEGIMANGDVYELPVYMISSLDIGGCIVKDFEAAEMPPGTRNLLGLSALKKTAPFAFSVEPAELRLSNCGSAVAAATP